MLSTFLKDRRQALNLSVPEAAVKAGVSYWRWQWLERPRTHYPPPVDLAKRIAAALECSVIDLYAAAGLELPREA